MISSWMLCFLIVGALLAVVGVCAEAIVARAGGPRRAVWAVAMLAMCALPLLLRNVAAPVPLFIYSGAVQAPPVAAPAVASVAQTPGEPGEGKPLPGTRAAFAPTKPVVQFTVNAGIGNALAVAADSPFRRADTAALGLWVTLSAVMAALLIIAQRRLRRARRGWIVASDDVTALVSARAGANVSAWYAPHFGPAVFGVRRPQVVIPEWTTELDDSARSLLLTHEASHIRSRDPLLLLSALAVVVVMPWNLPLLFAYRRLHRAVEHDCDSRVLAGVTERRQYGRLLLDVAERLASAGRPRGLARAALFVPAPMPGMGTYRTELEARLRALVRPVSTWQSRLRMIGAAAVVVVGLLAACSVPSPVRIDSGPRFSANASQSPAQVRVMQPTRGSKAGTALSVRDSLALYEQVMSGMLPRVRVIQDSIVTAAARRSEPHVFDTSRRTDDDVWLLMNEDFQSVASNTGRQYYSTRVVSPAESSSYVAATVLTPRLKLVHDAASYTRAFPWVRAEEVGLWSRTDVHAGEHVVHVMWARYVKKPEAPQTYPRPYTFADVMERSQRSWGFTDTERETAHRLREEMMKTLAFHAAPEVFADGSTTDPYVWLLVGENGGAQKSAVGRAGLFRKEDGRPDAASDALATAETPEKDLVFSCGSFRMKFRPLEPLLVPFQCGTSDIDYGGRKVHILWGVVGHIRR